MGKLAPRRGGVGAETFSLRLLFLRRFPQWYHSNPHSPTVLSDLPTSSSTSTEMAEFFDIQEEIAMRMDAVTLKSLAATCSTWKHYIKTHRQKFNRTPLSSLVITSQLKTFYRVRVFATPQGLLVPVDDVCYEVSVELPSFAYYPSQKTVSNEKFFDTVAEFQPKFLWLHAKPNVVAMLPPWWLSTVEQLSYSCEFHSLDILHILRCAPKMHHVDIFAQDPNIPYTPLQVVKAMNSISLLSIRQNAEFPRVTENADEILAEVTKKSKNGMGLVLLRIETGNFSYTPEALLRFFETTKFYTAHKVILYIHKIEGGKENFYETLRARENCDSIRCDGGFMYRRGPLQATVYVTEE
ncbi:unnamed protein product [Caenorhabditis auriculariae]|uniref:F-box domain-containing protein n=1 Tax=Caenorhabditis auriculariae TaxID=2777116 RepID=A0A8S1HKJ1_9PELO|nr:unnamed protein product [Caenorhabditis auriculariae]